MVMSRLGNGGATVIEVRHVDDLAALDSRIAAAQSLVRQLDGGGPDYDLPYKGVWQPDQEYRPGHFVTWGGNIYACKAATTAKPNEDHDAWGIAVKKGRDGRPHDIPGMKVLIRQVLAEEAGRAAE